MKRLIVEKNDKGKLNIDFLKDMALVRRRECSDLDTRGSPHPSLSIKDFYFYIEKVIYVDYSKAGVPSAREFKVKFRKKFEDVDNHEGVSCFLLEKVLELARLDELTNLVDLKAKVKDVKRVIWSGLER
jgi:hypothetical protein